jgi:hypothetical protein
MVGVRLPRSPSSTCLNLGPHLPRWMRLPGVRPCDEVERVAGDVASECTTCGAVAASTDDTLIDRAGRDARGPEALDAGLARTVHRVGRTSSLRASSLLARAFSVARRIERGVTDFDLAGALVVPDHEARARDPRSRQLVEADRDTSRAGVQIPPDDAFATR